MRVKHLKPSGFAKAKSILSRDHTEIALLIGNGINRAVENTAGISWKDLMVTLIKEAAAFAENPKRVKARLLRLLKENEQKGTPASNPEVFDLIAATCNLSLGSAIGLTSNLQLQTRVAELLKNMRPATPHRMTVNWAAFYSVPILTTNYDHCLQEAVSGKNCVRRRMGTRKARSDYYPWDRYYAPQRIVDPVESFAIWHIHGDRSMKRSIRAGLDQYMGMVQHLRGFKHKVAEEILSGPNEDQTRDPAYHAAPWLRVFMGKKLWIQGLALHADEVSLRWLLIQRFRYWKRYKPDYRRCSGWYVHGPTQMCGSLDEDRRAFLESVGLEVIEINSQQNLYQGLFTKPLPASGKANNLSKP
jgi:hypothetical protein